MADQLTGLTEVDPTIGELVTAQVQEVLTAAAVMPPLVSDFSQLSVPGIDTIKIPKMGNFVVTKKASGTPVDAQTNALTADSLLLDQHGVIQFLLEDIAELQSAVNVTDAYITQAAKDLAAEMDLFIINALESGVSTAAPDHKRAYAGASIAAVDILLARQLLNEAKVPLADRALIISPAEEAAVLAISNFVKANEIGTDQVVREGRIGRLYGFDVWMTPQAEDLKSLAIHKSALAFGRQLAPRYKMQPDLANLAERHSLDHLYGVKVMDSGKRHVLLGTA